MTPCRSAGGVWLLPNELSSSFKQSETICRCGCGKNAMTEEVICIASILRMLVGHPLRVNSGFRCESYNKRIGGSPKSQHLTGNAMDLTVGVVDYDFNLLVRYAEQSGCRGLGKYKKKNFVHLDCRNDKARWDGDATGGNG